MRPSSLDVKAVRLRLEEYPAERPAGTVRDDVFEATVQRLLSDVLFLRAIAVLVNCSEARFPNEELKIERSDRIDGVVRSCVIATRLQGRFGDLMKRKRNFKPRALLKMVGIIRDFLVVSRSFGAEVDAGLRPSILQFDPAGIEAAIQALNVPRALISDELFFLENVEAHYRASRKSKTPGAAKLVAMTFLSDQIKELAGSRCWEQATTLVNAVLDGPGRNQQTTEEQLRNAVRARTSNPGDSE